MRFEVLLHSKFGDKHPPIAATHIYAAGNRQLWREAAGTLNGLGSVFTADDSYPVLELATNGKPGLVLHGGTGSFVAARAPDDSVHYAGGIGWRFGDGGSGYDLGRRAIARGLLELQGWTPPSRIAAAVREQTGLGNEADAAAVTRYFYYHADPNRPIAALAPVLLRLAADGDSIAHQIVVESVTELLDLAAPRSGKAFSGHCAPLSTGWTERTDSYSSRGQRGTRIEIPTVIRCCDRSAHRRGAAPVGARVTRFPGRASRLAGALGLEISAINRCAPRRQPFGFTIRLRGANSQSPAPLCVPFVSSFVGSMLASSTTLSVLTEPQWRARQTAHDARVRKWTDPHQARAARGEKHPVYDFLFTYYSFRPGMAATVATRTRCRSRRR